MYENVGTRVTEDTLKDIESALKKYFLREVSMGRAVELARMSLVDFMKIVAERKINTNYSLESLKNDFKRAFEQER